MIHLIYLFVIGVLVARLYVQQRSKAVLEREIARVQEILFVLERVDPPLLTKPLKEPPLRDK